MKIVIIEDEVKAARSLINLITQLRPAAKVVATLQSIESAVAYLSGHEEPDLIFMDIQLSDGISFDILKAVKTHCPIVFCTAYGEYAMEAIKGGGIDYILKPFSKEDLQAALEKVEGFKNFFQQNSPSDLEGLLKKLGADEGKKSFLVFKNNKYMTVQTDDVAFFYIKYDAVNIMTFRKESYPLTQSMDQVQAMVSSKQFHRLNRQYLINFSAIKEVEHYSARKLLVNLVIPAPEELLVRKEKTTEFMEWLENR